MCGFLGAWGDCRPTRDVFTQHLDRMQHRGPDYGGTAEFHGLLLGHRRLAVIDLDPASNQPMLSACGRLAVLFNGEIYNYLELKRALDGYPFATCSDTEVILAAYLAWGDSFVDRLIGMFAIALVDRERNAVLLVRDPVGKKPLYYSIRHSGLAFASEIKALKGLPAVGDSLDPMAVNEYFCKGFVGGERTILSDISQVSAGNLAVFTLGASRSPLMSTYWRLPAGVGDPVADTMELVDELDVLLRDAVRLRMRSDVPLGAFLSGGLDSSLVVALAAQLAPESLHTFTISFPEASADEATYAGSIAKFFSTRHVVHIVQENMLTDLPAIFAALDQPFADSSLIPTALLCREARRNVTVALSGDGGDELFAGYGHYDAFAWEQSLRTNLSPFLRRLVGRLAYPLPERHRTRTLKRLIHDDPYVSMTAHAARFFNFTERQHLFSGPILANEMPERNFFLRFSPDLDWLQNICHVDFRDYLVDDVLVKVDRMSMLHSLEVRSPLLDRRIAEFAFTRVASGLKRRGSSKKFLLKQLARRYLPPDFVMDRKQGFGVPLGRWFDGSLGDRLASLLTGQPSGYVDVRLSLEYLKAHRRGFSNFSKKLFAILVWEEWWAAQRRGEGQ